jgi:hypothetical protein
MDIQPVTITSCFNDVFAIGSHLLTYRLNIRAIRKNMIKYIKNPKIMVFTSFFLLFCITEQKNQYLDYGLY